MPKSFEELPLWIGCPIILKGNCKEFLKNFMKDCQSNAADLIGLKEIGHLRTKVRSGPTLIGLKEIGHRFRMERWFAMIALRIPIVIIITHIFIHNNIFI